MAKVKLLVEVEIDGYGLDKESDEWLVSQVFGASTKNSDACLILHSNFIGDEIGVVEVFEVDGVKV